MRVANREAIEIGEKELLDAVIAELDWDAIEKKLKEKHNISLQEDVEFKNGDLVVHGSKIAYELNFDVKITLSVLFDRFGECIELSAAGSKEEEIEEKEEAPDENFVPPENINYEKNNEMASELSDMIDEINEE
ncbi:MAG: hypothetical protein CSA18_01170 [Deltaproteobacteria bacterium]|nr:MAG: hypothetical protein CSA18_01170 [Deltaproteobacteria bacterium]